MEAGHGEPCACEAISCSGIEWNPYGVAADGGGKEAESNIEKEAGQVCRAD